ncbi:MAG: DinB family protein [Acidobacteriia bacterium]|nr:DinB family protein [Terriglobia bacterium]
MKRILFMFLVVTAIALAPARAQHEHPATPQAAPGGAKAEFLEQVAEYEKKFTALAEAVPAEKYTSHPSEGVRTVGEVYAHVAAGNYMFLHILGVAAPAGVDPKAISGLGGDKAKTVQALKDSFVFMRKSVEGMDDASLESPADFFGTKTTRRGVFFHITGHLGEHLGQAIANARTNGVVPPWTAERMKKQAEKKDAKPQP